MMYLRFFVSFFLLAMWCQLSAPAQSEAPAVNMRADSTLVLIPVSVTDPLNRFVVGLEKKDFRITEDDREQTVSHFSGEDAPLSVGLLVDTSGSMLLKLDRSRQAVAEFMKTMNSRDEAFLVEFNDRAGLSLGFTSDPDAIQHKLAATEPRGLTALLDAMHIALEEMKRAKNPRKALLVISDGGDNHSQYTPAQITSLVREADVQIYAIGVFEPFQHAMTPEERSGPELLSELAKQTGGRAYPARRSGDLPGVATKVGIELRNQYILGYAPANRERDGKYRQVQVRLLQPAGLPPLKAFWRLGYYAPAQ